MTDLGGIENSFSEEFYIDKTEPVVESIKYEKAESPADKLLNLLTFGIYSNTDIKATVTVTDVAPSAGIVSGGIKMTSETGKAIADSDFSVVTASSPTEKGEYTKSFILKAGSGADDSFYNDLHVSAADIFDNGTDGDFREYKNLFSDDSEISVEDFGSDPFEIVSTTKTPDIEVIDVTGSDKYTDNNGKLLIENLDWGEYFLVEETAPDGYSKYDTTLSAVTPTANQVQFSVGRNTCDNIQELICTDEIAPAKLKIQKEINEYVPAWGIPTFIFKIKKLSTPDSKTTYERYVSLQVTHTDTLTDATDWIDIEPGQYEVTELNVSRYTIESCTITPSNDTETVTGISNAGKKAVFTVKANGEVTVAFKNVVEYYDKFSHNDLKVNNFHGNKYLEVLNKSVPVVDNSTGKALEKAEIDKKDFTAYLIGADGQRTKLTDKQKNKLTFEAVKVTIPAPLSADILDGDGDGATVKGTLTATNGTFTVNKSNVVENDGKYYVLLKNLPDDGEYVIQSASGAENVTMTKRTPVNGKMDILVTADKKDGDDPFIFSVRQEKYDERFEAALHEDGLVKATLPETISANVLKANQTTVNKTIHSTGTGFTVSKDDAVNIGGKEYYYVLLKDLPAEGYYVIKNVSGAKNVTLTEGDEDANGKMNVLVTAEKDGNTNFEFSIGQETVYSKLVIDDPSRFADGVYRLKATYKDKETDTGVSGTVDLIMGTRNTKPKTFEKTVIFRADVGNFSYYDNEVTYFANTESNPQNTFVIPADQAVNGKIILRIDGLPAKDADGDSYTSYTVSGADVTRTSNGDKVDLVVTKTVPDGTTTPFTFGIERTVMKNNVAVIDTVKEPMTAVQVNGVTSQYAFTFSMVENNGNTEVYSIRHNGLEVTENDVANIISNANGDLKIIEARKPTTGRDGYGFDGTWLGADNTAYHNTLSVANIKSLVIQQTTANPLIYTAQLVMKPKITS